MSSGYLRCVFGAMWNIFHNGTDPNYKYNIHLQGGCAKTYFKRILPSTSFAFLSERGVSRWRQHKAKCLMMGEEYSQHLRMEIALFLFMSVPKLIFGFLAFWIGKSMCRVKFFGLLVDGVDSLLVDGVPPARIQVDMGREHHCWWM